MWGISYIITAIVAPSISDAPAIFYGILGAFIIIMVFLMHFIRGRPVTIAFFALGIMMTYGGVVSWTGAGLWNVPFPNKDLFQISMAFADMLSAVFLFLLGIEMARK